MAEGNMNPGMPEADIATMKETLCAQQQLLQKLYVELDAEREASGSAVSEALSMILRLQDEKSAIILEANQYKRMQEERICHAEESLAAFEEILYQKEMEISALEHQIQAYEYKLLSFGCSDVPVSECGSSENLCMQRNDACSGENGCNGGVRRLKSLSPIELDNLYHTKIAVGGERSSTPEPDMFSTKLEEKECQEVIENCLSRKNSGMSIAGDFNYYWEQIVKLDERVKEIADYDKSANLKTESRLPPLLSQGSIGTSSDQRRCRATSNLEKVKDMKNFLEKEVRSTCSSFHDIFEVPKPNEKRKSCERGEKGKNKRIWEGDNRLGKPDPVMVETLESNTKDETERVNATLHSPNQEKILLSRSKDGISARAKSPLSPPKINHAECQAEFQQLSHRVEQLEALRNSTRHEIAVEGEEQLNLLKQIREQLNSIQSEMKNWRTKKSPPVDEPSLCLLREAMLYFWL